MLRCVDCNCNIPNGYRRSFIYNPHTDTLGECCEACFKELLEEFGEEHLRNVPCCECGEPVGLTNLRSLDVSFCYCNTCFNRIFWVCMRCCSTVDSRESEGNLIQEYHGRLCDECYERYLTERIIRPYDYSPEKLVFYKSDNEARNLLYFGIELEIESNGNDKIELAKKLPEFTYAKHDGSLNDGFEIVSHPATYRWLMENKKSWGDIFEIKKAGWRSFNTETCGMHVHISKNAFGNFHLYKFMRLFYYNPQLILKISQRIDKNNLDRWASIKDREGNIKIKALEKRTYDHDTKYTAVSLYKRNTVEVRIFRGTLCEEAFWKNVEFVKAAYNYSQLYKVNDMIEIKFRKFVRLNKNEFPNLHSFLYNSEFAIRGVYEGD